MIAGIIVIGFIVVSLALATFGFWKFEETFYKASTFYIDPWQDAAKGISVVLAWAATFLGFYFTYTGAYFN